MFGEILNSYPKSFYSYEPLTYAGIQRIHVEDPLAPSAVKVLKSIFTCDFSSVVNECKFPIFMQ